MFITSNAVMLIGKGSVTYGMASLLVSCVIAAQSVISGDTAVSIGLVVVAFTGAVSIIAPMLWKIARAVENAALRLGKLEDQTADTKKAVKEVWEWVGRHENDSAQVKREVSDLRREVKDLEKTKASRDANQRTSSEKKG